MLFANNPTLYGEMYKDELEQTNQSDMDFIEMQPQSEEELKDILADMRSLGVLDDL